ncbi:MAG: GHKL domain-containing protein [Oscillospiraceae bacterium]|nr:GHKL domain-containing protein [Oscillospiraceae bacterium]
MGDYAVIFTVLIAILDLGVCCFLGGLLSGLDRPGQSNNTVWKVGFAIGLTLIFFLFTQIFERVISLSCGAVFSALLPLALVSVPAIVCYAGDKSLIPKDVSMLLCVEHEWHVRLRRRIAALAVMQITLLLWHLWLLFFISTFTESTEWILVIFTAIALVADIYCFNLSIASSFDYAKALVDQQYQRELLDFMQIIREQRHDFNLHLQTVAGLVDQERYCEARAYMDTIVGKVSKTNELLPIKNPAVSALVHTFVERAALDGIRLDVRVEDSMENLRCTAYEMNTIIGNLVKNAIEEVRDKDPDLRYIKLVMMHRSRHTVIRVSNPCDKSEEELRPIFSLGYTTKKAHEGIGLVAVKKICSKYGGTVYIELGEGVLHVIAKIPRGDS